MINIINHINTISEKYHQLEYLNMLVKCHILVAITTCERRLQPQRLNLNIVLQNKCVHMSFKSSL